MQTLVDRGDILAEKKRWGKQDGPTGLTGIPATKAASRDLGRDIRQAKGGLLEQLLGGGPRSGRVDAGQRNETAHQWRFPRTAGPPADAIFLWSTTLAPSV